MNFDHINSAFQNSFSGRVQIHLVHSETIDSLFQNIFQYRKLRFENDPNPDTEVFTLLNSLRFHFAMAPVSPGHPEFGMEARLNDLEGAVRLASDSRESDILQNICSCLREMETWADHENPLLARLFEVADEENYLLRPIARFRTRLDSVVQNPKFGKNWRVAHSNSISDEVSGFSNCVVFGHPMFHEPQEYRKTSSSVPRLLRDPLTTTTTVIMYGEQGLPSKIDGVLNSDLPWKREYVVLRDLVPEFAPTEAELSDDDVAHLEYRISRNSKVVVGGGDNSANEETVEAKMVLLRNGRFVLKNFSEGAHQYVVHRHGDSIMCRSVDVSNIQSGSWIIERDAYAETDMIESVANSRFGASKLRKIQHQWKAEVRKALRTFGHRRLARLLAERGVRVNPQSIQHWGNDPHSIGPDSFERVQAMCQVIELDDPEKIWAAMQRLRSSHISAGHAVREDLENAVRERYEVIKKEVEESGMATVHLDGCGDLGIYLVDDVSSETFQVSLSELNFVQTEKEID